METELMKILQIENFSLQRQNRKLFSGLSMDHQSGDVVLWFGPSGCGKSSLAKAIAGQVETWQGVLNYNDKRIAGYSVDRLYVGHDNDLFLWQTSLQHIEFLKNSAGIHI